MCNCLKEVGEKLELRLKDQIGMENVYSFDQIGFDNMVFSLEGARMGHLLTIPFSIRYSRKKKDGSKAKTITTERTSLYFAFCPFCGEKYPENSNRLTQILIDNGYLSFREIPNRGLCGIKRFAFTSAIVYGINEEGYEGRWCYETQAEAQREFLKWDGIGDPSGDWIKHKGVKEYSNPNL